jgi:hypothetical protein
MSEGQQLSEEQRGKGKEALNDVTNHRKPMVQRELQSTKRVSAKVVKGNLCPREVVHEATQQPTD